jgi:outer membrane protein OmpA-like peptidoglycan-associated protein
MIAMRRQEAGQQRESAAGEGGYLASASDLMIGLLFVFIILVVVLALEQRRQQQLVDEQTAKVVGAGDPLIVVTKAIGDALAKDLPNIRIDPETGVISLPEGVLFPRGSAQLSDSGRAVLGRAAEQLALAMPCYVESHRARQPCPENPYAHEIETIFIEGHTDSVPFVGGVRDNFDLSLARARSVQQAMVTNGPLAEFRNKAGQPIFSFSAYADSRPLPGTDPMDGANRRVDLRIVLSYKPIGELVPALKPKAARTR